MLPMVLRAFSFSMNMSLPMVSLRTLRVSAELGRQSCIWHAIPWVKPCWPLLQEPKDVSHTDYDIVLLERQGDLQWHDSLYLRLSDLSIANIT